MPEHPTIYICLLCGWQGPLRELHHNPAETTLFCPSCGQPASYLMDLSEPPHEFLALRRSSYISSLEAKRDELKLKQTPELRKIIRKFKQVLEADA